MKISMYIQLPEACRFIDGAKRAYKKGSQWNCFVSINLEKAGIKDDNISKHVRDSIVRLRRYHKRNGMAFSCGWVIENVESVGTHVHLIIHRSEKLPMHPMKYYWSIIKRFQIKRTKGVVKAERFWRYQGYETNLTRVTRYCLKGLRPGSETEFTIRTGVNIVSKLREQGLVMGKRIGWTRN